MRAVLFDLKLARCALLKTALHRVVKVWAADAQNNPVCWKQDLRLAEVHVHIGVLLIIE